MSCRTVVSSRSRGRPSVRIAARARITATKLNPFRPKAGATPNRSTRRPAHVERIGETVAGRQNRHVPVLDMTEPCQQRERERLEHEAGLGGDDQAALRQPIGESAGQEGEAQHGSELQRSDEAELEGGVGQLQNEPGLCDTLHPGSDQRDQLAGDEETEVTMVESAQTGGESHGVVGLVVAAWSSAGDARPHVAVEHTPSTAGCHFRRTL